MAQSPDPSSDPSIEAALVCNRRTTRSQHQQTLYNRGQQRKTLWYTTGQFSIRLLDPPCTENYTSMTLRNNGSLMTNGSDDYGFIPHMQEHPIDSSACSCGRIKTLYCLQCDAELCSDCIERTHQDDSMSHGFIRITLWYDIRARARACASASRDLSTNKRPMLRMIDVPVQPIIANRSTQKSRVPVRGLVKEMSHLMRRGSWSRRLRL